jgi:hypothetical protein
MSILINMHARDEQACLSVEHLETFPMMLPVLSFRVDTNRAVRFVSSLLLALLPVCLRFNA